MENVLHHSQTEVSQIFPSHKLVFITQKELTQLKWTGNYWKAQHKRACQREAELKKALEHKDALLRDLRQRLFGKKGEKGGTTRQKQKGQQKSPSENKRPRGQQKGSRGHGRTERPDLAVTEEHRDLHGDSCSCPQCGLPFKPFPGDEESEIFEIDVKAYKRRVYRKRYKKSCSCPHTPDNPGIIVALPAPKVIPRSPYGVSVWEHVLLGKFLHCQPLHRILQDLKSRGLPISQGTLTGGLQKISELFLPIEQALHEKQMSEDRFHNDESRWEVYEAVEGKVGHRWYLWVTRSSSVIYYRMDPSRSAEVPLTHFSDLKAKEVIVICDRYSAYKKLARKNSAIILAFCWAHVRRDFLDLACSYPTLKDWGLDWVDEIGTLYHLNQQRLELLQESLPLEKQSVQFHQKHALLKKHLKQMKDRRDRLLLEDQAALDISVKMPADSTTEQKRKSEELHRAQRKVLASLQNHWKGLTVFVDHPEIPMDNNSAEQAIRGPVTGRKNYYGSGSIWSAILTARMFSTLQTVELWQLNSRHWLREYLEACARHGGKPPDDLDPFLPWQMSQERRKYLKKPPPIEQSSLSGCCTIIDRDAFRPHRTSLFRQNIG